MFLWTGERAADADRAHAVLPGRVQPVVSHADVAGDVQVRHRAHLSSQSHPAAGQWPRVARRHRRQRASECHQAGHVHGSVRALSGQCSPLPIYNKLN